MESELLAEYAANSAPASPQKEYGHRGGQLLVTAEPAANVRWLVSDHLGTPRMIADRTGSLAGIRRHDYLPFGEELFAGTGNRTAQRGYPGSQDDDNVRQQFTGKERDDETGLDYFDARHYSSPQGRFTSTDPILLTNNRLIDPQQINLYNYARNNPLRFTDPSGEDIDDSSLRDNEDYQKWKKAFLATKAGQALWNKYNDDHNFTLKITMGENAGGKEGAETRDFVFNANGTLTGATIVLGTDFAKNAPSNSTDYPIGSSLTPSEEYGAPISREARAVGFLAHEFGHVEDAQRLGALWQEQDQLLKQNEEGFKKMGAAFFNTKEYQQIVSQLGDTPVNIGTQRDTRAEAATIPVLRQYFGKGTGHGDMPKRVKQAIQNYEKAHPH